MVGTLWVPISTIRHTNLGVILVSNFRVGVLSSIREPFALRSPRAAVWFTAGLRYSLPGSELQYSSSGRECDDPALSTLKRTTRRCDVTQRVTANDSAAYSRANCAVVTKSARRRTSLVPEKCDLPSILLHTVQTSMNTAWKRVYTS